MIYLVGCITFFLGLAVGLIVNAWHRKAPIENDDPHDVRKP